MTRHVAVCEDCRQHGPPLYLRKLPRPETDWDQRQGVDRTVLRRGLCNDCWAKRQPKLAAGTA